MFVFYLQYTPLSRHTSVKKEKFYRRFAPARARTRGRDFKKEAKFYRQIPTGVVYLSI